MRTLAIINQKGGCGKTTTSINLAACLARLGQRTLLIDMDPQGHCGVGLAVPEEQIERTIYDALIEEADGPVSAVSQLVWQISTDFDLAPSSLRLAAFEQVFSGRPGREDRLRNALVDVAGAYQWCIIDCPPSVGLLTFNALRACDEVLVPVETGFFSLHGLAKMLETLEEMRDRCDREIRVRILPTQYDTRTRLGREVLAELRNRFREHLTESTINFNTKLKEAASYGQPITEYDPGSRGYKDFVALAKELIGERQTQQPQGESAQPALSRPAELAQRARQLQQLASAQFGRVTLDNDSSPAGAQAIESVGAVIAATAVAPRIAEIEAMPLPVTTRTTEEKIEDFYGCRQIGDEVVFAARFDEAQQVAIAGDFNDWSAESTVMERGEADGEFRTRLPLAPGRYRYRLVVDGQWLTDPFNKYVEANQFGELNNVVEVE